MSYTNVKITPIYNDSIANFDYQVIDPKSEKILTTEKSWEAARSWVWYNLQIWIL